jgi:hypothetical protein
MVDFSQHSSDRGTQPVNLKFSDFRTREWEEFRMTHIYVQYELYS